MASSSSSSSRRTSSGRNSSKPDADASKRRSSPTELWAALRRIFAISRPYRLRLYTALVLTSIGSLVALVVPLGLRELLNAVFQQADRASLDVLTIGLMAVLV